MARKTKTTEYDYLDDPAERAWLTKLKPADVVANAHRIYEFMAEGGMEPDSFTRELAFTKASDATGRDYDEFYYAWLNATPLEVKR